MDRRLDGRNAVALRARQQRLAEQRLEAAGEGIGDRRRVGVSHLAKARVGSLEGEHHDDR